MITTLHNFIAVMQCYTMLHISYIIFSLQLCQYAVLRDATLLHKVPTSLSIRIEKATKSKAGKPAKHSCQSKPGKPANQANPGKLGSWESQKAGKPNHSGNYSI